MNLQCFFKILFILIGFGNCCISNRQTDEVITVTTTSTSSTSLTTTTTPMICLTGWTPATFSGVTQCYVAVNQALTMAQAQAFCAMTTGGNLVSIHSAAENTFVTQLAAAIVSGTATDTTGQTWIGYTLATKGPTGTTWQWSDGSVADYPAGQPYPIYSGPAPWVTRVPSGNFNCAILISNTNGATYTSSSWNEADCTIAQANFVCKAPTI